jgi:hypothetical protein
MERQRLGDQHQGQRLQLIHQEPIQPHPLTLKPSR